ncbi:DUF969 domain-containing protein [Aerococcaceae bacterium DSM 111020]|nr:DUF969 domain-containing protein [Aerococcaceae bacterium DSM 111020]
MELLPLIGIIIIVIGFILKLDTISTVVVAGLVTALAAGISFIDFLEIIGESFVNNRIVSLFFITLPMIGIAESYGLRQQSVKVIQSIQGLTMGLFYSLYLFIRLISGFFSIRLGGHPQFVRPIIHPMGEAAIKTEIAGAEAETYDLPEVEDDKVKALAAANDNFGNFFGQNTFLGASGVLLIVGVLKEQNYIVEPIEIAKASIPIAIIMFIIGAIYNYLVSKSIVRRQKKEE